ncbi:hypothetical protein O185_18610 [Photorhabdus temperata J3]|uniref:Solute-binding protein family 5 domain-containing protein n=1 Tax=Photorhabdus temperata J3 TaxID=1389415 RepID=U7QUQ0_PHOTE|nr:hypothetical protein O185_18610 [Photorhabdus temperata J3]
MYSWQRLVTPVNTSPFAWFAALAGIENAQEIIDGKLPAVKLGVKAIDTHILQVTLNRPVPYFPNLTANFSLYPVNKKTVEKYGKEWIKVGNLVGNGAFKLHDRVVNEKIVLTPNPYYWDHKKTVLTKVTFVPINQESHATKRYLAGDLDITESFPKNMYKKLRHELPGRSIRRINWAPIITPLTPNEPQPMMPECVKRFLWQLTVKLLRKKYWEQERNPPGISRRM